MSQLGRYAMLAVHHIDEDGAWLGDGTILLPAREGAEVAVGAEIRVFVYGDKEDRPTATTLEPDGVVGQFVLLRCVDLSPHGAFLDWGLPKDLFVPWSLQHEEMEVSRWYVVRIDIDERTGRVVGSSKLARYLDFTDTQLKVGDPARAMVYAFNDLGAQVIVDGRHAGIIYADRHIARPRVGDTLDGWVQRIREDGRMDISLSPLGRKGVFDAQVAIVSAMMDNDGFLPLTDRSPPEEIRARLSMSKKAFKRAVGALYKSRRIAMEDDGWRLIER